VNILLLNYSLRPQGGSQMTSVSIAEALARRGHQVVYGAEAGPLVERLRRSGIGFIDLPSNRRYPQMQNLSAANVSVLATALQRHRIDVIHCFQYFLTVAVSISRLVRPAPLFVTLLGPRLPSHRQPPRIAQLFAVSEELRDVAVREEYERGDRITILPHRIDFSRYGEPRGGEDLARRLGLAASRRTIVMLSTFELGKVAAIRTFVAAAERLRSRHPEACFVIGGDGPHLEEIRREAERINGEAGSPALTLPGILDVPAALDLADIVVGMGRSALEGMAASKPTVVVGSGGFVAVADQLHAPLLRYTNFTGRGGEVPTDPAGYLADVLGRLLAAPAEATAVGEFGRRFVRAHYDIAHAVSILEEAYEEAVRNPARPRRVRLFGSLVAFMLRSAALSGTRRVKLALKHRSTESAIGSPGIHNA
jgi:glycosyltransferase involved in cell wall biosynthesis